MTKYDLCSKAFIVNRDLMRHKKILLGERNFMSDQCEKVFNHIRKHRKIHTDEKEYLCNQYGKALIMIGNLNTHQKGHTTLKEF